MKSMYGLRAPLITLLLLTLLSSCGGGGGGGGGGSTSPTTSAAVAPISGNTTSSTDFVTTSSLGTRMLKSGNRVVRADSDPCDTATFEMHYLGSSTIVASGSVTSGAFTIPDVTVGQEAVVTFTCSDSSTQRCLVKSGDTGILCNAVADAVISAFESIIGINITDSTFSGKTLSKVGSAIVEAAKTDTSASDALKQEITTCKALTDASAKQTCYKEAINSSPFAGALQMMRALAGSWDVETLFTLVVDTLGFKIEYDTFMYSDFATAMDGWLGTDFVASSKALVAAIINDQLAGTGQYLVKIECQAHYSKYRSGGSFTYDPVVISNVPSCKNDTALEKMGLTEANRTTLYAAIDAENHSSVQLGSVSCDSMTGWDQQGYFCMWPPSMQIVAKYNELNRNDLGGQHSKGNDNEQKRVSIINVFSELDQTLESAFSSGNNIINGQVCVSEPANGDGPPVINQSDPDCVAYFGSVMGDAKQYFAGIMGLYMYLKDPTAYGTGDDAGKFSLDDIHKIFTHNSFVSARLAAWMPEFNGQSVSINGNNIWFPPLLAYDSAADTYSTQDVFRWDASPTQDQILAAVTNSVVPYAHTFQMYESIPTSTQIQAKVFGDAHHEEWNPLGPKYFNVPGVQNSGFPIFCKMTNSTTGKAMEEELKGTTAIACLNETELTAAGVTITNAGLNDGLYGFPDGFAYPYVLQQRGWMGDDKGKIYVLADRKTGFEIRPGEREVFVLEQHSGNQTAHGACYDGSDANSIVSARIIYGWGSDTKEEAVDAYCMNMSDLMISSGLRFYHGGEVEISEDDGQGNSWSYHVQQVGRYDTVDTSSFTILPVCLYASSSYFTETNQLVTAIGDSGTYASGNITNLGSGSNVQVDLCSQSSTYTSLTQYYVVMFYAGSEVSDSADRANLKAYLVKESDSSKLRYQNWSDSLTNWEDQFVTVSIDALENKMDLTRSATDTSGQNSLAPSVSPTYNQWVKLLNSKHDPKFDPYCDDSNGNGYCDCYLAGTTTLVEDPTQCTLQHDAAEPTMSEPPYWSNGSNTAAFETFFATYGGKAGTDLGTLDGTYVQTQQLWMNFDNVFQCAFLAIGETSYRKPDFVRWDGFYKKHEGCPDESGNIVAYDWGNDTGGGYIRLLNPKPMNNAYNIEKPNTVIKLLNFAFKTSGQGITIAKTDKVFSFDEALALISLRFMMPPDVGVYTSGVLQRDAFPFFEQASTGGWDTRLDASSAVLRAILKPAELDQ